MQVENMYNETSSAELGKAKTLVIAGLVIAILVLIYQIYSFASGIFDYFFFKGLISAVSGNNTTVPLAGFTGIYSDVILIGAMINLIAALVNFYFIYKINKAWGFIKTGNAVEANNILQSGVLWIGIFFSGLIPGLLVYFASKHTEKAVQMGNAYNMQPQAPYPPAYGQPAQQPQAYQGMTVICPYCNSQIPADSQTCPRCGAKLK